MGTSSFLKKWSTLFIKTVNPFRENGQLFLKNGQPFLKKQSTVFENQLTVLRKTVDPFCGKVSFRNKKRGCVYFDTPSY